MSHRTSHPSYNITYIELLMSRVSKSEHTEDTALTIIKILEDMLTSDAVESCKQQALGIVAMEIDMDHRMSQRRNLKP